MAIPEKILKYKFHILFTLIFFLLISVLIYIAPRFLTILAYFWPLLLSTALFLIAVLVFGRNVADVSVDAKAGEGILDYVAGEHEVLAGEHEVHATGESLKTE